MATDNVILLVSCPDQSGIVQSVTSFVLQNDGNIIKIDQCIDDHDNYFFMRIEWSMEQFRIPFDKIHDYFETLVAKKFNMKFEVFSNKEKLKLALFVTKATHCLFDIIQRCISEEWNAEISVIISNHQLCETYAQKFNIPYYHIPITKENKLEQEAKQIEILEHYKSDYIILARYMQIITDSFIEHYKNKIINIHHSFLPSFKGANPYKAAYLKGVKIIGATSHFVTADLDEGPIIEQDVRRIQNNETVKDLARKGRDIEKIVLARAIDLIINRRVIAYNGRTIILN